MDSAYDHFNVTCGSDGNWVDPGGSWPNCVYKCKVPVAETGYNAQSGEPSQGRMLTRT